MHSTRQRMKVQLVANPTTDSAFRLAAERVLGLVPISPEGLQSGLRGSYPHVAVVRGIEDHGAERWYAYGTAIGSTQHPADRNPNRACSIVGRSSRSNHFVAITGDLHQAFSIGQAYLPSLRDDKSRSIE